MSRGVHPGRTASPTTGPEFEPEERSPGPIRSEPPRPIDQQHLVAQSLDWVRWFGLSRLVAAAGSVLVVVAGLWWLLRAPPVPAEQRLPNASGVAPTATLEVSTSAPTTANDGADSPTSLIIQVAGNVVRPGVYEIASGGRVIDAIDAAGGTTTDGDPEALNLAAPLSDGARIYVPAVGEIDPKSVVSDLPATPAAGTGLTGPSAGPVNINTADTSQLESLPGIGPATAAAIVEDRERNGPFSSVDDLDRVPGIGPAKLAKLQELIVT